MQHMLIIVSPPIADVRSRAFDLLPRVLQTDIVGNVSEEREETETIAFELSKQSLETMLDGMHKISARLATLAQQQQ